MKILKSFTLDSTVADQLQKIDNQSQLVETLLREYFAPKRQAEEIATEVEILKKKLNQDKEKHDKLVEKLEKTESVKKKIDDQKYPQRIINWMTSQENLPEKDTAIIDIWEDIEGTFPIKKVKISTLRETHKLIHSLKVEE